MSGSSSRSVSARLTIPELRGESERLPDDAGPDSSGGPCEVSCRIPVSGRAGRRPTGRLTLFRYLSPGVRNQSVPVPRDAEPSSVVLDLSGVVMPVDACSVAERARELRYQTSVLNDLVGELQATAETACQQAHVARHEARERRQVVKCHRYLRRSADRPAVVLPARVASTPRYGATGKAHRSATVPSAS